MDFTSGTFLTMRGWELRMQFARYILCTRNYGLDRTTFSMELRVQAIRQGVTPLGPNGILELVPTLALSERSQLLRAMLEGRFVPRPLPAGRQMVNPLLIALRRNSDPSEEEMVDLLDTMLTLLLAS